MKNKFTKLICSLTLAASTALPMMANAAEADKNDVKNAKYVFLFIGDGMAVPQRVAADLYQKSQGKAGLTMQSLPVQGYTSTFSATSPITDSAAAGTAIATGYKTKDGIVGMDADKIARESVAELAKKKGKKVGIITSTSINHATPGSFYAHQPNRGERYKIALEMPKSGFDYFAGGGIIDPTGTITTNEKGHWFADPVKNKKSAYDVIKDAGFTVVKDRAAFENLTTATVKGPVYVENPHQDSENNMYYTIDMREGDLTLADFVAKGIELMKDNKDGFFIMTEGGKIDWAAHGNDLASTIVETVAFDDAITVAYDFAKQFPNETLIIVTGDHETGGMTVGCAELGYKLALENASKQKMSFRSAQAQLNIMKKQKAEMKGVLTFEEVMPFITETFGLKFEGDPKTDGLVLSDYEKILLETAFDRGNGVKNYAPTENPRLLYSGYDPLIVTATKLIAAKSGIGWTSFEHTATPVGTSAYGVNARLFGDITDNTDISKNIRKVLEAE